MKVSFKLLYIVNIQNFYKVRQFAEHENCFEDIIVKSRRAQQRKIQIAVLDSTCLFTDLSFEAKFIWPPHENSSDEISKLKLTASALERAMQMSSLSNHNLKFFETFYRLFLFEIECAFFYTNLHELFCQFIS